MNGLLDNEQFFRLKLLPAWNARVKDKRVKIKPVQAYVGDGSDTALTSEEWLLTGPALLPPVGLDPTNLRASCADNPAQMADFLVTCATGRLHISCWQYLIGPITQIEYRLNKRPSYRSLLGLGKDSGQKALTATEKVEKEVDKNISIDADYLRIAKKRDFDNKFREKLLANRPHLLEEP